MNTNANVEAVSTINYSFTAIPTNLFMVLDNNCRSTLFSLIQLSTYYAKEDGYFYRTNSDLEFQTNLSKNVINAALDALYINGIIDVIPSAKGQGKKQSGKYFKVNFESFLEFEKLSIEDAMKNEDYKIYTPNYKGTYTPSFNLEGKQQGKKVITTLVKSDNLDTNCNTTLVPTLVPTLVTTLVKSDNNINNIENKDNKNNIYNNINKNNINIYNNILEENSEEIGFGDNPISDNKEFENYENIEEVGLIENPTSEKEEKENTTSTMKEKFEKNFNDLLSRLGDNCSSVSELDNKVTLLCNWVENHNTDYSKEERETILNQLVDRYTEVKEILESNINELDVIFTDFCSIKEEKPIVEEKKTTTKEQLIKNLQAFQESLVTYENLEDAKHQLHFYCNKEDKLIREYELTSMVGEILNEINLQIEANKAFLTTFNLQGKETYYNEEIMQENALKSISYKVDDTEDYPF